MLLIRGRTGRSRTGVVGGLRTVNPDGTGQTRIATGRDLEPAWSPDGAAHSIRRRRHVAPCMYSIHVVNADGSGEAQLTSPSPQRDPFRRGHRTVSAIAFTIWVELPERHLGSQRGRVRA